MLNINACLNKTAELRLFLIVLFFLSSVYLSSILLSSQNKERSIHPLRNILPASQLLTVSLFFPFPFFIPSISLSVFVTPFVPILSTFFYSPSLSPLITGLLGWTHSCSIFAFNVDNHSQSEYTWLVYAYVKQNFGPIKIHIYKTKIEQSKMACHKWFAQ